METLQWLEIYFFESLEASCNPNHVSSRPKATTSVLKYQLWHNVELLHDGVYKTWLLLMKEVILRHGLGSFLSCVLLYICVCPPTAVWGEKTPLWSISCNLPGNKSEGAFVGGELASLLPLLMNGFHHQRVSPCGSSRGKPCPQLSSHLSPTLWTLFIQGGFSVRPLSVFT